MRGSRGSYLATTILGWALTALGAFFLVLGMIGSRRAIGNPTVLWQVPELAASVILNLATRFLVLVTGVLLLVRNPTAPILTTVALSVVAITLGFDLWLFSSVPVATGTARAYQLGAAFGAIVVMLVFAGLLLAALLLVMTTARWQFESWPRR